MTDDMQRAREKFEAWLSPCWSQEGDTDEDGDFVYREEWVQGAWVGFRAALRANDAELESLRAANECKAIDIRERDEAIAGWAERARKAEAALRAASECPDGYVMVQVRDARALYQHALMTPHNMAILAARRVRDQIAARPQGVKDV